MNKILFLLLILILTLGLTNQIYAKDSSKLDICKNYKKFISAGVPEKPLKQALLFFVKNKSLFKNKKVISIADYSQNSVKNRFYRLNLETGEVIKDLVSHGSGYQNGKKMGDINHDGMIDMCKYKNNRTNMTRPGFFKVSEEYMSMGSNNSHKEVRNKDGLLLKGWPLLSKNTNALRLDGLTNGVNNKSRSNGVVMHGAWYNDSRVTKIKQMGRSYGCPAFHPEKSKEILNSIKNASLFYAYVPICKDDMKIIEKQVEQWKDICK